MSVAAPNNQHHRRLRRRSVGYEYVHIRSHYTPPTRTPTKPTHALNPLTSHPPPYIATVHTLACRRLGIKHLRTRPYRPQTNGKAERFIRTLIHGWAYGAIYRSSQERTAALDG